MPDPILYLKAGLISAVVSGGLAALLRRLWQHCRIRQVDSAYIVALSAGAATGLWFLEIRIAIPPTQALDRLFVVLLPTAVLVELGRASSIVSPKLTLMLWAIVVSLSGFILLYQSSYLPWDQATLPASGLWVAGIGGLLLAIGWGAIGQLAKRFSDFALPFSLAASVQIAGILVMLAGYIKGGAVCFPFAFAFLAIAMISPKDWRSGEFRGVCGIGMVLLFGVLFIGRFFGGLSNSTSLVVYLSPLVCWATSLPGVRSLSRRSQTLLRIAAVIVPLLIAFTVGKQKFDREMGPLIGKPVSRTR